MEVFSQSVQHCCTLRRAIHLCILLICLGQTLGQVEDAFVNNNTDSAGPGDTSVSPPGVANLNTESPAMDDTATKTPDGDSIGAADKENILALGSTPRSKTTELVGDVLMPVADVDEEEVNENLTAPSLVDGSGEPDNEISETVAPSPDMHAAPDLAPGGGEETNTTETSTASPPVDGTNMNATTTTKPATTPPAAVETTMAAVVVETEAGAGDVTTKAGEELTPELTTKTEEGAVVVPEVDSPGPGEPPYVILTTTEAPSNTSDDITGVKTSSMSPQTIGIICGVIGGIVLIVLIILIVCCIRRRRTRRKAKIPVTENPIYRKGAPSGGGPDSYTFRFSRDASVFVNAKHNNNKGDTSPDFKKRLAPPRPPAPKTSPGSGKKRPAPPPPNPFSGHDQDGRVRLTSNDSDLYERDSDGNEIELSTFGRPPKPPRTMDHVIREDSPTPLEEEDALLTDGADVESSPNSPSGGRHERSTDYSDSSDETEPLEAPAPLPNGRVDDKYLDDDVYDPNLNPFVDVP